MSMRRMALPRYAPSTCKQLKAIGSKTRRRSYWTSHWLSVLLQPVLAVVLMWFQHHLQYEQTPGTEYRGHSKRVEHSAVVYGV
jgi:hypothetical protein